MLCLRRSWHARMAGSDRGCGVRLARVMVVVVVVVAVVVVLVVDSR